MRPDCPTCASLLRAVIAEPDDDLPRLIAADHLAGDHHEEDHAEFIRIECELVRTVEVLTAEANGLQEPRWHVPNHRIDELLIRDQRSALAGRSEPTGLLAFSQA